jgi:hypothetical protein
LPASLTIFDRKVEMTRFCSGDVSSLLPDVSIKKKMMSLILGRPLNKITSFRDRKLLYSNDN